jgi:uncharacterized damage-inducible protein DinB
LDSPLLLICSAALHKTGPPSGFPLVQFHAACTIDSRLSQHEHLQEIRMNTSTVRLFARYNEQTNALMNDILSTLSPDEWKLDRGGYLPSIASLCSHICSGDRLWLTRFRSVCQSSSILDPMFDRPVSFDGPPYPDFSSYISCRITLDKTISSFAHEVTSDDLKKTLSYTDLKGVKQNREVGGLIMHMFNHQTHHRGMISLYLDQMGRENDFSSMVPLV